LPTSLTSQICRSSCPPKIFPTSISSQICRAPWPLKIFDLLCLIYTILYVSCEDNSWNTSNATHQFTEN
jgi:hypothetical protein